MKKQNWGDRGLSISLFSAVGILLLVFSLLVFKLIAGSTLSIQTFGLSFLSGKKWNPVLEQFSALPFIYGTLVTSLLALFMATPLALSLAVFNTEIAPRAFRPFFKLAVETLATIPSIIYGLWALFTLAPFIRETLAPFLESTFPIGIFQGPSYGIGLLTASLVLCLMIIPTITAVATEILKTVPAIQKEGMLALGSTRFEMIRHCMLAPHKKGILAGLMLGLGRALGETMAVAMVIGNKAQLATSLFAPSATLSSIIANEYSEASSDLHLSSLTLLALLLLVVSLAMNLTSKLILTLDKRI